MTWDWLHLDDERPWIELPAWAVKSRRPERSPIRRELVAKLKAMRGDAADDDPVWWVPSIAQLRNDLAAAGVPFADAQGNRRLDFHAFRRTAVRLIKSAGLSVIEAQALLHHKDLSTTRKHYDEGIDERLTALIEQMPAVTPRATNRPEKPKDSEEWAHS